MVKPSLTGWRVRIDPSIQTEHDGVFVVESLRANNLKTGTWLFNNVIKPVCDRRGLHCALRTPQSSAELEAVLDEVATLSWVPILHLEVHGGTNGIQVANRDLISWDALYDRIRAINIATRNNLLLSMSACKGINAARLLVQREVSTATPVRLVLGPEEVENAGNLQDGFASFFNRLLGSPELGATFALQGLSQYVSSLKFYFADQLFASGFNNYISVHGNAAEIAFRVSCIVGKELIRNPRIDVEARARQVEAFLTAPARLYRLKRRFFMIDLYPELEYVFRTVALEKI